MSEEGKPMRAVGHMMGPIFFFFFGGGGCARDNLSKITVNSFTIAAIMTFRFM